MEQLQTLPELVFKDGVDPTGAQLCTYQIIRAALIVWGRHGEKRCTVTSLADGKHSYNSLHDWRNKKNCRAVDFRDFNVTTQISILADDLQAELGPAYDVVLEADHIHAEYDPKPKAVTHG